MPTLLVVEDDPVDRQLVTRCLEEMEGLELDFVGNGEAALSRIGERSPHMVLTDLRMPGMGGLELVQRLQEQRPELPVVLMTSKGNERVAVQALQAGAASYVPKRDLRAELAETISKVLLIAESRRRRTELLVHLAHCEMRFELINDPELIYPLAGYLMEHLEGQNFGSPAIRNQIGIAVSEAVSNAMVHGNLEVGSELRKNSQSAYRDMIERRRGEEPYASRRVRCTMREVRDLVEYAISDEGPGFAVETLPDPTSPENLLEVSGRGVMLIRTFMDTVSFNRQGNQIIMTKVAPSALAESDQAQTSARGVVSPASKMKKTPEP